MADAFSRYEALKKTSPDEERFVLAQLASADAIVAAIDDLKKQVVESAEALAEVVYDIINEGYDDDFDQDEDYDDQ